MMDQKLLLKIQEEDSGQRTQAMLSPRYGKKACVNGQSGVKDGKEGRSRSDINFPISMLLL
jgi:hypothetical protein